MRKQRRSLRSAPPAGRPEGCWAPRTGVATTCRAGMRRALPARKEANVANSLPDPPPAIEKRIERKLAHGVAIEDEYAWLKAANWQEVLRDPAALPAPIRSIMEAENAFANAALEPYAALRKALVKEMRGRIKEDDAEVPPGSIRPISISPATSEGGSIRSFAARTEDAAPRRSCSTATPGRRQGLFRHRRDASFARSLAARLERRR